MDTFRNGVTLHHIGYVVASIRQSAEGFARSLGMQWDGRIIHDPRQTVYVSFLYAAGDETKPVIELVEPEGPQSVVARFLERGGGLHHLCYEVDDLSKQLEWTRANRDLIAQPPVPAVAFGGRRIAWVFTRSRLLIEYLERRVPGPEESGATSR